VLDPYALDQIKEFANIVGMSADEVARFSKIKGMEMAIEGDISPQLKQLSNYDEILSKISSNAFYNKDLGQYGMNITNDKGEIVFKQISQVGEVDLGSINVIGDEEDVYKDLIRSNESLSGAIQNLTETFKRRVIPEDMYNEFSNYVVPLSQDARDGGGFMEKMENFYKDKSGGIIDTAKGRAGWFDNLLDKFNIGNTKEEKPNPLNPFETYEWGFGKIGDFFGIGENKQQGMNVNTLSTQMESYSSLVVPKERSDIKGKIDFGEIGGEIKVTLDGGQSMNVDAKELFSQLMPEIRKKVQQQIYEESENQSRTNPKSSYLYTG